jgi:hypothetical protein
MILPELKLWGDGFSSSGEFMKLFHKLIVNDELERLWKEELIVYF